MVTIQTLYNDIKTLGLQMFQEKLISGSNIKTINNNSLLGSGNLSISGGGGLSFDDIYPIGSIYISTNNTDPSTLFGGTWVQLKDQFLLGAGDTYTAGDTGGEATHTLTVNEIPSHNHTFKHLNNSGTSTGYSTGWTSQKYVEGDTSSVGGGQAHNNMPPYLTVYMWKRVSDTPTVYFINDAASVDNSSTLFGNSIALRNSGSNTTAYNNSGYYTIKNAGSQKESFRVLSALTGVTDDFCIEYDSYVEGSNGSSGFVIYNSATSWEKLTDDADSNKKLWYGYNNGSFHETAFYGNLVTNQKWVHYKYTVQGTTFTMEVTYNDSTVVTHSETIHLTRGASTQYGLDSEWQLNTQTRYKNIQAYTI